MWPLFYFHMFGHIERCPMLDILKDVLCRQLEKLQTGVDTVITDVKVVFPFALLISFSLAFLTFFHPSSNFQGVQKDINMLNGKLERSFFEICMGMKAKIRNKEPYVEHSMGLLRSSCTIFALLFPTFLEKAFLVKISSDIFRC